MRYSSCGRHCGGSVQSWQGEEIILTVVSITDFSWAGSDFTLVQSLESVRLKTNSGSDFWKPVSPSLYCLITCKRREIKCKNCSETMMKYRIYTGKSAHAVCHCTPARMWQEPPCAIRLGIGSTTEMLSPSIQVFSCQLGEASHPSPTLLTTGTVLVDLEWQTRELRGRHPWAESITSFFFFPPNFSASFLPFLYLCTLTLAFSLIKSFSPLNNLTISTSFAKLTSKFGISARVTKEFLATWLHWCCWPCMVLLPKSPQDPPATWEVELFLTSCPLDLHRTICQFCHFSHCYMPHLDNSHVFSSGFPNPLQLA